MFTFNMSIEDNFALFKDDKTSNLIFIDSFDNKTFEVRFGTILKSEYIAEIVAETTDELNNKLGKLALPLIWKF